jgi:hypothetical protein
LQISFFTASELVETVIGSKGSMIMRKILFDSRDEVLTTLQRLRG